MGLPLHEDRQSRVGGCGAGSTLAVLRLHVFHESAPAGKVVAALLAGQLVLGRTGLPALRITFVVLRDPGVDLKHVLGEGVLAGEGLSAVLAREAGLRAVVVVQVDGPEVAEEGLSIAEDLGALVALEGGGIGINRIDIH